MATRKRKIDLPTEADDLSPDTINLDEDQKNFENFENFDETSIAHDHESPIPEEELRVELAEDKPRDLNEIEVKKDSTPSKETIYKVTSRPHTQPKIKPRRHRPRFSL